MKKSPHFKKFPEFEKVSGEKYLEIKKGIPRRLFVVNNLLVTGNDSEVEDYVFSFYDLKTKILLKKKVPFGAKNGEAIAPITISLKDSILWLHDISANKILTIPANTKDEAESITEFELSEPNYSVQYRDKNIAFASGNYIRDSKVQMIDLKEKKIVKEIGNFNDAPNDIPISAWKRANESFLFLNTSGSKLVSALRYSDQIEVFDLKTQSSKVISGPENYNLEFNVFKKENIDVISRNENTRFAFLNGYVNDKFIYLLYSGQTEEMKTYGYGKQIYIYNWEGVPIKKIILPEYSSCFTVDENNQLYWFDVKNMCVKKDKISL